MLRLTGKKKMISFKAPKPKKANPVTSGPKPRGIIASWKIDKEVDAKQQIKWVTVQSNPLIRPFGGVE
jgi:hypothetical protein